MEQVKGVIDNPTEYCYDKFIGQITLEELRHFDLQDFDFTQKQEKVK